MSDLVTKLRIVAHKHPETRPYIVPLLQQHKMARGENREMKKLRKNWEMLEAGWVGVVNQVDEFVDKVRVGNFTEWYDINPENSQKAVRLDKLTIQMQAFASKMHRIIQEIEETMSFLS